MKITIYDYSNKHVSIIIPDKEIKEIYVNVQSGDETGIITFQDGEKIYFDASERRILSFYDGSYIVTGDNIQKWIDFVPPLDGTFSYERMYEVESWIDDEAEVIN